MWSSLKLALVFVTLGVPAALIGIPYTVARGDIALLYRVAMRIAALGLRAAGVRVRVEGREHVPPGVSCIFLCNHVSNLDPPVILPLLPGRAVVFLKRELMRIPLLGTAMRLGDYIPVDRSHSREAAQRSVAAAAVALGKALHILVFPEGTRSADGRLSAFKKGPFFLAMATGAPVVPVVLAGSQHLLPKGSGRIEPGAVRVRFLPALMPASFGSREALMEAVRAAMTEALPAEMRPDDLVPEVPRREAI